MTRVVVAGAGIGGLTSGIAPARAGVAVDLHERADELREVGARGALPADAWVHDHDAEDLTTTGGTR